jgi:hypothetical protein
VSVLNLPATQTVTFTQAPVTFGTAVITGSASILNFPATQTVTFGTSAVTGSVSVLNFPASQAVTFTQASVTFSQPTITGSVSVLNFPASQSVTFTTAVVTFGTTVVTGSTSIIGTPSVTFGTAVITGSTSIIGTASVTFTQIATHGVTIGAGTAQIGSVTASISGTPSITFGLISGTVTASLDASGVVGAEQPIPSQGIQLGYNASGEFLGVSPTNRLPVNVGEPVVSGRKSDAGNIYPLPVNQDGEPAGGLGMPIGFHYDSDFKIVEANYPLPISGTVTIGSLPAISGTVTANLSISSTVITSGSFTSLTSATLVPADPARKMATVYNLGAGQLFVNAGETATTLGGGFMVALSAGDFYECPYTTTTLSAIFATAGTASWVSH